MATTVFKKYNHEHIMLHHCHASKIIAYSVTRDFPTVSVMNLHGWENAL